MTFIISMWIPDSWKSAAWLLWDRRKTWGVCRGYYRDFQHSYEALRFHEHIDALLKKCKSSRGRK